MNDERKYTLPVTKEDTIRYHNDELIVRMTAEQVIKDFGQFGMDILLPSNLHMAYNELFDQLAPNIHRLMDEDQTRFYSLLYRIDVNESAIHKGSLEMTNLPVYDVVTHLILERELKKVLTRMYFSRNT